MSLLYFTLVTREDAVKVPMWWYHYLVILNQLNLCFFCPCESVSLHKVDLNIYKFTCVLSWKLCVFLFPNKMTYVCNFITSKKAFPGDQVTTVFFCDVYWLCEFAMGNCKNVKYLQQSYKHLWFCSPIHMLLHLDKS